MPEEYRMIKCERCGHERRGPRIVRVSDAHKKKLDTLLKKESALQNQSLGGFIVLLPAYIVGTFIIAAIAASPFVLAFSLIALYGAFGLGSYLLLYVFLHKQIAEISSQKREIVSQYGVRENEWYEIANDS